MRTTLKRGIGRGASLNGNGRAVLPPAPPSVVTRYRQPEPPPRTGRGLVWRILLWLLVAVLVVASGLLGGVYLYFHEKVAEVQAKTPEMKRAAKALDVAPAGRPATALVVGYDHRAGIESRLPSRSDTIMLIRADPVAKTISLLSFPRDLVTQVYCPGKPVVEERINYAYQSCKTIGTVETVRQLTGLQINYLITVDFRGFKQVVDRIGGVWMDVDRRYFNDNSGLITGVNTYATIDLRPGYQRLSGSDALDFVRYRHTDSDLYRVARQQAFVKAFKEQVSESISPLRLPKLVDAITSNVQIGQAGNKAISGRKILSYALFGYGLPSGHFFQPRIENLQPAGPYGAELSAPPGAVEEAVRQFSNPDVDAPEKATEVALGKKLRKRVVRPSEISLVVLNGNGVTGSASNASYELAQRRYRVVVPPDPLDRNAPSYDYFHTEVYFDPARPKAKVAARQVANLFGDADVAPIPPRLVRLSANAMLLVVVGKTFHGTLAPAPVDQTPRKQPPVVVENPGATIPLLREAQKRVSFRLHYPRLIERSSSLDSDGPVHTYRIAKGHQAVRLVFQTGDDFWGIEETDWADAPVLQGPNFKHVIKGRRFDLYYSGPHLHMVVLRRGGATYWVVNTLLDKLSNETMLAIAKSLRPLGK